ncbi:hypothetical protein ACHAWF_017580 [Thalassiosira exigua]
MRRRRTKLEPTDLEGMIGRLVGTLDAAEAASLRERWSSSSSSSPRASSPPLRVGTICSGTDAPVLALERLASALKDAGAGEVRTEHAFSCESVEFKRRFVARTTDPPLLFVDAVELASSGRGRCHDGTTRDVPSDFDVLVAGTECVDFSGLSSTPKGLGGGGRSDVTFSAALELARTFEPAVVVLENVARCPAREMEVAFEAIGYVGGHVKVCTSDYLLPQSRRRAYFLFLRETKAHFLTSRKAADWVDAMERLGPKRAAVDREEPLAWTDFLEEKDAAMDAASKKASRSGTGRKRGKSLSESGETKWLAEVEAVEAKEGLVPHDAAGGRPYSDATRDVPAIADLPDRAKLRLDVQCKRALRAGIDPFATPLLWNPAQQLRFTDAGFGSDGTPRPFAPCVTPKHEWIVSSRRGALTGAEALALQGFPITEEVRKEFDSRRLRDLAGNAMSSTVVAAAFLAAFLTVELVDGSSRREEREERAAPETACVRRRSKRFRTG